MPPHGEQTSVVEEAEAGALWARQTEPLQKSAVSLHHSMHLLALLEGGAWLFLLPLPKRCWFSYSPDPHTAARPYETTHPGFGFLQMTAVETGEWHQIPKTGLASAYSILPCAQMPLSVVLQQLQEQQQQRAERTRKRWRRRGRGAQARMKNDAVRGRAPGLERACLQHCPSGQGALTFAPLDQWMMASSLKPPQRWRLSPIEVVVLQSSLLNDDMHSPTRYSALFPRYLYDKHWLK